VSFSFGAVEQVSMNAADFEKFLEDIKSSFRFEYVGGGYFRDKRVPQGTKADVLHGSEILDEFCAEVIKRYSQSRS
jgi:hypothetical protein